MMLSPAAYMLSGDARYSIKGRYGQAKPDVNPGTSARHDAEFCLVIMASMHLPRLKS